MHVNSRCASCGRSVRVRVGKPQPRLCWRPWCARRARRAAAKREAQAGVRLVVPFGDTAGADGGPDSAARAGLRPRREDPPTDRLPRIS